MGILDVPSYSRSQSDIAQRDMLVPVATRAAPPFQQVAGLSDGTILGGTAKVLHVAVRTFASPRLAFSNFYPAAGVVEADTPNPITVRAAFEPVSGTVIPITFAGRRSVTIEPGATVYSDPLGVDIVKGATFYTRTYVEVATGQKFPKCQYLISAGTEGHNYASPIGADLTATGSATVNGQNLNTRVFGPSMILGRPADPGRPVIGLPGDSVVRGTGDNDIGLFERALGGSYSFVNVAFPSENMSGWIGSNGLTRFRRQSLLAAANITHIITDYTVNSLGQASFFTDALAIWTSLRRLARYVYATTLTPQTTSTDAWATVGNQTPSRAAADETRRISFNTWMRDGAPIVAGVPAAVGTVEAIRAGGAGHPLTGIFEVADLAESARNSGRWRAGFTSDGIHPNPTGAVAMKAAIDPSLFGSPSTS